MTSLANGLLVVFMVVEAKYASHSTPGRCQGGASSALLNLVLSSSNTTPSTLLFDETLYPAQGGLLDMVLICIHHKSAND